MRALFLFLVILLVLPVVAEANDRFRTGRFNQQNIRVHLSHRDTGIRVWSFRRPSRGPSPCFPHGCGGISGPSTNPDPDARKPENLTACIYNAKGTLLYEREGKKCDYKVEDSNKARVELRRQEWLRSRRGNSPGEKPRVRGDQVSDRP